MKFIFYIFIGFIIAANGGEKGPAWESWKKLEKVILESNEKESLALLSGRMKEGFFKFGMASINNEVRAMNTIFKDEFANEKDNTRYIIIDSNGEQRTLMFIKSGKNWLFDEQLSGTYITAEDAAIGFGQFIAQQQMKKVYDAITEYCTVKNLKRIPPPAEMKLKEEFLTYRDPGNGDMKKIHVVRNVDFEGKFNLLLAVTDDVIGAKHQAIFEDAHYGAVTREQFKEHSKVLGLEKSDAIEINQESIEKLVTQLGNGKSKERKDARQQLMALDETAIKFLTKFVKSPDLEIRLSIGEIIEVLSKKRSKIRPKF